MRSEILRTGAIVGHGHSTTAVLANDDCDESATSAEYEPLAPLDALKEISRKRIHCDESASSIDNVKKQRADEAHASSVAAAAAAAATANEMRSYSGLMQSKRGRDKTSPTYQ